MRSRVGIVCVLAAIGCNRLDEGRSENSVLPGVSAAVTSMSVKTPSTEKVNDLSRDAGVIAQSAVSDADERRVNEIVSQLFGDPSRYGDEELKVVRFIEDYLNRYDPKFTKKRRCVVHKLESGWDVDVINVEGILEGRRDGGLKLHVTKKGGRFRVVDSLGR